jgi:L-Lysine epsilon oxidase N-terminal/von Willebrand factor type A domain
MAIKVHPGIGVARIGDSPEYFIGPEVPTAVVSPPGGFRDAECRIKRQAALFRIFEHLADGTATEIVSNATTTITWTVNLRRTIREDASAFGPDVVLSTPGSTAFVPAPVLRSVPADAKLAEIRTDAEGRLLVLCGDVPIHPFMGRTGPDGRAEGYVRARVVREGVPLAAVFSSWVVIYPPDYAPALHPPEEGPAGRLRTALWPDLAPTSPGLPYTDQLDRGPLTFVGAFDGSVSGSAADFREPFRFLEAGPPGPLLNATFGSWAGDLAPAGSAVTSGCSTIGWLESVAIAADGSLPRRSLGADWKSRGFVAELSGGSVEYVDWCPTIGAPAQINFFEVPRGTEQAVPFMLDLMNFPVPTAVTGTVVGQPSVRLATPTWDTPTAPEHQSVSVVQWAFFRAAPDATPGVATGTIELEFGPRHRISIPLRAQIVEEAQTAVALVLDCSASMAASRGDGVSRLEGLKEAVNVFVDVAAEGSVVAVVPFSTTALTPLDPQALGDRGSMDEAPTGGRGSVREFVRLLRTQNLTAIGAGIQRGQELVDDGAASFPRKALIVVTDGYETSAPYIADVMDSITANTYAIGIGRAFEPALRDIVRSTDGFVSIMNDPVAPGNRYTLSKYFLQALAGITASPVVVDPEGELSPGEAHRIPFVVSDADMRIDITVVSDKASELVIGVEGPNGKVLTLEQIQALGRARVTRTARVARVELWQPFDLGHGDELWGTGSWAIWVGHLGKKPGGVVGDVSSLWEKKQNYAAWPSQAAQGRVTYLAMATTASSLRMTPSIQRVEDGVLLEVSLSYGGAPILQSPNLFVELTTPAKMTSLVPLLESSPGCFRAHVSSSGWGRYRAAFRARGSTPFGSAFQRELVIEESFVQDPRRHGLHSSKCSPSCSHFCLSCKLPRHLGRLEEKLCEAWKTLEEKCRR